jgi:hypothetical protein
MTQRVLTADIIAKEAIMILENNCVMGNLVYRGYEEEFSNGVNGYEKGETISIRRPTDFTVRSGAVAAIQEVSKARPRSPSIPRKAWTSSSPRPT